MSSCSFNCDNEGKKQSVFIHCSGEMWWQRTGFIHWDQLPSLTQTSKQQGKKNKKKNSSVLSSTFIQLRLLFTSGASLNWILTGTENPSLYYLHALMNQPALKSMALFFIIIMVSVRCNNFSEGVVQDNQNALLFFCFDVWYFMCVYPDSQSSIRRIDWLFLKWIKMNKNILFIVKKKIIKT